MVQAAVHKGEGTRYAIKVVENDSLSDEENLEALETEIKILRQLSHPHIVQLKEARPRHLAASPPRLFVAALASPPPPPPPPAPPPPLPLALAPVDRSRGVALTVQVVHTTENTYIVMELLSGGELFNRLAALAESAPSPWSGGPHEPARWLPVVRRPPLCARSAASAAWKLAVACAGRLGPLRKMTPSLFTTARHRGQGLLPRGGGCRALCPGRRPA